MLHILRGYVNRSPPTPASVPTDGVLRLSNKLRWAMKQLPGLGFALLASERTLEPRPASLCFWRLTASFVATVVATTPLAIEATGATICHGPIRLESAAAASRRQRFTMETGDLNILDSFLPPPNHAACAPCGVSCEATSGSSMAPSCEGSVSLESYEEDAIDSRVSLPDL